MEVLDLAIRRSKMTPHVIRSHAPKSEPPPQLTSKDIADIVNAEVKNIISAEVHNAVAAHLQPLAARIAILEKMVFAGENVPTKIEDIEVRKVYPKIPTIIKLTAAEFNLPPDMILADRRDASIVLPRHVAIYLACRLTLRSLPEIGRQFRGRDHTTCLHAKNKIAERRKIDPELDEKITNIERALAE